jgi:hypothetical protein
MSSVTARKVGVSPYRIDHDERGYEPGDGKIERRRGIVPASPVAVLSSRRGGAKSARDVGGKVLQSILKIIHFRRR